MLQGLRDKGSEGQVCRGLGVLLQVLGGSFGVPRPHPSKMLPTQPGRLPGEPLRPLGSAPDNSPLGALPEAPRTPRTAWARPANSFLAMPGLQRPKRCLEEPPTYTTTPGARRLCLAGSSRQRCGWPRSWFLRVLEPSRSCCVTRVGAETSTRPLLPAQNPRPGSSGAPPARAAGTPRPLLGPPRAWVAGQSGPSQPVHEAWRGREGVGAGASSPGRVGEHGEPGELRWPHGTARPGSAPAASQHGATPPARPRCAPCGEPGGGPPGDLRRRPVPRHLQRTEPTAPAPPTAPAAPTSERPPPVHAPPSPGCGSGPASSGTSRGGPGLGTGRGGPPYPLLSPALPRPRSRSSRGWPEQVAGAPRGRRVPVKVAGLRGAAPPSRAAAAPSPLGTETPAGSAAGPSHSENPGWIVHTRARGARAPATGLAHARGPGAPRRSTASRGGPARARPCTP